jgi:hypothetical protein
MGTTGLVTIEIDLACCARVMASTTWTFWFTSDRRREHGGAQIVLEVIVDYTLERALSSLHTAGIRRQIRAG